MLVGDDSFNETGQLLMKDLLEFAHLRPHENVLDLGCGFGRVAIPLTEYLSATARYDGVDVVPDAVSWCRRNIEHLHPGFRFHYADLANTMYNPTGTVQAADYEFPCQDGSVDLVFATSLFTHMLPADVTQYLRQSARVLSPQGRLLASFFVLDDCAWELVHRPGHGFPFVHEMAGAYVVDPRLPEAAVAYREQDLLAMLDSAGLELKAPIRYGEWSGRADGSWGQDTVVAALAE